MLNWYSSENVQLIQKKIMNLVWVKSTEINLCVGWHEYNYQVAKISSNPYFHTSTLNTSAIT